MKTVLLRASVLTASGYGVHSRQIARWLLGLEKQGKIKLSIQALGWGETPWLIDRNRDDGFIGELMAHTAATQKSYDVSFQVQLPNEFDISLAKHNVGITAGVETDRCNSDWVTCCNKLNHLVVPSQHTKNTLSSSGTLTVPVSVIPESYPDCYRDMSIVDLNLSFDTSFNYLVFGQITGNNPETDRKNLFYTVKWACETLKDKPDTGLVIKTNAGRNTKIDRHVVKNILTQLKAEVAKTAKIYLVHGDMSDKEVYSLMKHPNIQALVALTRGEGFGLPILEAAAAGVPIIGTNWSAHTEFLNLGRWIPVDYRLAEIPPVRVDNKVFIKGTKWAQPVEDDFKRKLRKFHDSSTIPRTWARDLKPKILDGFSHQKISSMYSETFKDVLL